MLVLDSGAVTHLSERSPRRLALIRSLKAAGLWPPVLPTVVLVECLRGDARRDVNVHRFVSSCTVDEVVTASRARRAAELRRRARRGSAVDAIVVALAEPGGVVLTGDAGDIGALAAHATRVHVEAI